MVGLVAILRRFLGWLRDLMRDIFGSYGPQGLSCIDGRARGVSVDGAHSQTVSGGGYTCAIRCSPWRCGIYTAPWVLGAINQ